MQKWKERQTEERQLEALHIAVQQRQNLYMEVCLAQTLKNVVSQ